MKLEGKIARRYARALFEACPPPELENVQVALGAFTGIWESSLELREAMSNPASALQERERGLRELAAAIQPNVKLVTDFLVLLLNNKRLFSVVGICECFVLLVNEFKRILALEVVSAAVLSEAEMKQIQGSIEAQLPKQFAALVSVSFKVDKAVLGGLQIRAGDKLLDGSLSGILGKLEKEMLV